MHITATYSPEDNKLRLSASSRLDPETYARVKAAGYSWAPKQELFIAPAWSPEREDLALELAGEIEDEDSTLVERAEERAERFEDYSGKRVREAETAHAAVERIAGGIPLGQPILVGHHSERHARKDAERIENGMRRAVRLFDTARYWTDRAAGAVRAAKYKERPDVRARRIKGLEADERKWGRDKESAEKMLRLWTTLHEPKSLTKHGAEVTFRERALFVCNIDRSDYSSWSLLDSGKVTPEEVQAKRLAELPRYIATCDRWLAHLANRLAYERAMLAGSGYVEPPKPKTSAALPLLNYPGEASYRNPYRGDIVRGVAVPLTKAEWAAIHADYKGTRVSEDGTHRLRTAMLHGRHGAPSGHGISIVYLSDSATHPRPSAETIARTAQEEADAREEALAAKLRKAQERAARPAPTPDPAASLREALRSGVSVVAAPQLFPTPAPLVARMMALAEIETGHRVLEPSSGTGALLEDLRCYAGAEVVGVEIVPALAERTGSRCADFLACNGDLGTFDRVVMNPPFADGADVRHILHARTFLRPGGRLVALCAAGPRQEAALRPLTSSWEVIPDAFKEQRTGVRVALLVIEVPR